MTTQPMEFPDGLSPKWRLLDSEEDRSVFENELIRETSSEHRLRDVPVVESAVAFSKSLSSSGCQAKSNGPSCI